MIDLPYQYQGVGMHGNCKDANGVYSNYNYSPPRRISRLELIGSVKSHEGDTALLEFKNGDGKVVYMKTFKAREFITGKLPEVGTELGLVSILDVKTGLVKCILAAPA